MITLPRALQMLNGDGYDYRTQQPFIEQWRQIFYRTSIHTTGACPRFYPLGDRGVLSTQLFTPSWWLGENYDYIFDTHLFNKYPLEPEVSRQWRKSVYRPHQMAPLLECIAANEATILGDSKYTLYIDDKDDSDYINGPNFEGKSFIEYFRWYFKAIHEDPNSLFCIIPKEAGYQTSTKKVEPTIKHIRSTDILYILDNEIIFYEWQTRYAWFVNDLGYFRFEQREDDRWYPMDADYGYYAHLLTYKPVHFAGGIWNTNRYYDSYLKPALPACDDFVSAKSDSQMIDKQACHPLIAIVDMDCPTCNGHKQLPYCLSCNQSTSMCQCQDEMRRWANVDCKSCNGSGVMSRNPGDWIVVPKADMVNDLVKVTQFSTAPNIYLDEKCDKIALTIKKALHQHFVEEAQSGVAKEIDRTAMYLYRSSVSNGIWDLIEHCLIDILSIRNTATVDGKRKPDIPKFTLVRPTDFDLKTEWDLLSEYKESTESKTPEYVRQKQIEQYVDKCFGGDDIMVKMSTFINEMDAFSVTPLVDKIALLSASGISQRDFQFSNELPRMMKQVLRDKGKEWFLNADFNAVQTEINLIFAKIPPLELPLSTNKIETIV